MMTLQNLHTDLSIAAAIERGRTELDERRRRSEEAAAEWQREQDERNRARLAILPTWMHEYARTNDDEERTISIVLPGCAPIVVKPARRSSGIAPAAWVREPMAVEYDDDFSEQWLVATASRVTQDLSLDALVALAADWGDSYWAMRAEADRRNSESVKPEPRPIPPAPETTPDPLVRIAGALDRIAAVMEFRLNI